jgi:hypothetical protein
MLLDENKSLYGQMKNKINQNETQMIKLNKFEMEVQQLGHYQTEVQRLHHLLQNRMNELDALRVRYSDLEERFIYNTNLEM